MAGPLRVLVAQPEVQRQLRAQLEVVLDVKVVQVVSHDCGSIANVAQRLVWQPKKIGCQGLPGIGHVLRIDRRVLRETEIPREETIVEVAHVPGIDSELEEMTPLSPAEVGEKLIGMVREGEAR